MAGSPQWKVFDAAGKYQAACKEPEAAAALMGFYGRGATIRWGHSKRDIAWTEGTGTGDPLGTGECGLAGESFDFVAHACYVFRSRRRAEL